jgi:hypothetical protein
MDFKPGFRLSKIDILAIIGGVVVAGASFPYSSVITFLVLFVVGHFFLFCNIIRMSRPSELIWSGIFLALSSASLLKGFPSWSVTVLISTLLTAILVVIETRKSSYHGVSWQKINPGLPDWFSANISKDGKS